MRDIISHRGPDDHGTYLEGNVGLAHRRLSIIDLSSGHQPMSDPSERVWIVFNGEIYNFPQLRRELQSKGYPFRTHSDTEVIVAQYLDSATDFVGKLNGIFTFAIWDRRERTLTIARDRVGVKPLYLWQGNGLLAVASEVKSLLAHPDVAREVDASGVAEYLVFRQLSADRTLFKGIGTVAPGEILVVSRDGVRRRRYWDLPSCAANDEKDERDYADALDELLGDATRMQMISDVPLGTYNSGGVDSSLITSYVAEKTGSDLNTFSIGIPVEGLDERSYANLVAEKYRTRHRELVVSKESFEASLDDVIWYHDEPLTHPNTVPIFLLTRMVKRFVTVVLTGEGCDEFFGGYPRYRIGAVMQAIGPVGRSIGRLAAMLLPAQGGRAGKLQRSLRAGREGAVTDVAGYVAPSVVRELLDEAPDLGERRPSSSSPGAHIVEAMLQHDQRNYLLPILNRLDKATMASSVEARVPFLDHRLIEFAATLPVNLKVRLTENKYLVKKLASRRLPRQVVYRKKSGLALPIRLWFREHGALRDRLDALTEPLATQRGLFKPKVLKRVVEEHRRGTNDHSELLWALVNLESWHRVLVDKVSPPPFSPYVRNAG